MTITTLTTSGVLPVANLREPANWRAFFHQLVAVVVPILVTLNLTSENTVAMWLPFVFAIADNLLSLGNVTDRLRRAVYGVVGALQAGGLVVTLLADWHPEYVPVASAVLAVATAFLARFHTPTSTVVPVPTTEVPYPTPPAESTPPPSTPPPTGTWHTPTRTWPSPWLRR